MASDCQSLQHVLNTGSPIKLCAFSRSSDTVVTKLAYGRDKVWDPQTGRCLHHTSAPVHVHYTTRNVWVRTGERVVSISHGTLIIQDLVTGACPHTLPIADIADSVTCYALSPDGSRLAIGSRDDTTKIWNIHTNTRVRTLRGYPATWGCVYSLDGSLLAVTSSNFRLKVWNPEDGTCICTLSELGSGYGCYKDCAFSPRDAMLLATISLRDTINLWNARTGVCLDTLVGHESFILKCVFSSDGVYLATASKDNTARIWTVYTGTCVHIIQTTHVPTCCDFSVDCSLLVTSAIDTGIAHIWRLPAKLRHHIKLLLLMIIGGYRDGRLWLPTELWDWIYMQWVLHS